MEVGDAAEDVGVGGVVGDVVVESEMAVPRGRLGGCRPMGGTAWVVADAMERRLRSQRDWMSIFLPRYT